MEGEMENPGLFVGVAMVLASAPLVEPSAVGVGAIRLPAWAPFALLTILGAASCVFAVLNPEVIAAAFYAA
jgi:hypothetical protein